LRKSKAHITKVVDLVTRNSEQLDLYFYDFSTIYYRFYKFAIFENKRKRNETLQLGPWNDLGACKYAPGRT
jgi:hypothetical protein